MNLDEDNSEIEPFESFELFEPYEFTDITDNLDVNENINIEGSSNEIPSNEGLSNEGPSNEGLSNEGPSNENIISDGNKKKIIFRKPRQKTSQVWKYFDDKGSYAICNVIIKNKVNPNGKKCGQKYSTAKTSSTSTLSYHLKQVHQISIENNVSNKLFKSVNIINILKLNLFYIKIN